jgi:hypothetical protein
MSVLVSCPYCNAGVALAEVPPSGRAVCPRCGEAFPVRPPADDAPRLPDASPNGPPVMPSQPVTGGGPPGRSLRSLALLGAVLGVVVLAVGLYAVYHSPGGRATAPTEPGVPKPAATVPPAALPGLAYLPAETNVAFAVQPGPLLAYAGRANRTPREALAEAGVPDRVLAALDRLGLRPEQIDHACGGLVVAGDNAFPRAFVALLLTEPPDDPAEFRRRLQATQFTAPSGATRYKADLAGLPAEMANPDPRTYLFATDGADLDTADQRKGRGSGHLPAGLRESLTKLSPASVAWAATDADRWADKPAVKLLAAARKQPDLPARLAEVRAAAVGVSLEPDLRLTAAVRAADPDAAAKLREQATAAGGEKVRVGGDGPWVTVEGPPEKDAWAGLQALLPKPAGK